MIVHRRQIDHTVLDLIASFFCRVEYALNHGNSFDLIFTLLFRFEPKEEFIDSVIMPLDTIYSTIGVVDVTMSQNAAVTGGAH